MSTTTRRGALLGTASASLLGAPSVSAATTGDEELVSVCARFAENEIELWYKYVIAPDDVADQQDGPADHPTHKWIVDTPATTPSGWQAKALALSAWSISVYIHDPGDLLTSLLQDMVAPARKAIMARCAAKYGPLPETYTAEGDWMGYDRTAEEQAAMDAAFDAKYDKILEGVRAEREART
jgi:hypothetical protein